MPTYSIASALYMTDETGEFVGDPVEALRSVAASGYSEVELIAEGPGWEDGPPDSKQFREALESTGLYPHTIHAPFKSINLASFENTYNDAGNIRQFVHNRLLCFTYSEDSIIAGFQTTEHTHGG